MSASIEDKFEVLANITEDCQWLHIPHYRIYQRAFKKFHDQELLITIQILKSTRSDKQNRYMWSCIVPHVRKWLHETQGVKYSPDYVYAWLRAEILKEEPKVIEVAGTEVITLQSKRFSAMTTKEFAEAVDTIRAEMLLRGLDIPEPTQDKTKHNLSHEFLKDYKSK